MQIDLTLRGPDGEAQRYSLPGTLGILITTCYQHLTMAGIQYHGLQNGAILKTHLPPRCEEYVCLLFPSLSVSIEDELVKFQTPWSLERIMTSQNMTCVFLLASVW